jgi:hypothetical protein
VLCERRAVYVEGVALVGIGCCVYIRLAAARPRPIACASGCSR